MSGFLVDTNVLIEGVKGNEEELFELINNNLSNYNFYIPINAFEEIIFILLREFSKLSYWKLKKDKNLVRTLFKNKIIYFWDYILNGFEILPLNKEILNVSKLMIREYGLLPNDALILATCKHYNIPYLLSLDEDFKEACEKRSIVLVDSIEKLKKH